MSRVFVRASGQYLTASLVPASAAPLSLSARIWVEDLTINHVALTIGAGGVDTDDFRILINSISVNDPVTALVRRGSNTETRSAYFASGPNVQTWHHMGGVFRSSETSVSAVADGVLGDSSSNTKVPTAGSIDTTNIGVRMDGNTGTLVNGRVAEVAAWAAELNADEWIALGKGYSPACIRPSALVLYLPLIDDADIDLVSGTQFTPINAPTVAEHPPVIYRRRGRIFVPSTGGAPAGDAVPVCWSQYRRRA